MAEQERHLEETCPSHSNTRSLLDTYVEIKMEDVGRYNFYVDSPEKSTAHPSVTEVCSLTEPFSSILPVSPDGFEEMTNLLALREPQPREIQNLELNSPPQMPKPETAPEDERSFAERYPPIFNIEDKGKGRAPPTTFYTSERKLEDSKITVTQLREQLAQATKASSQLESQLFESTTILSRLENQLYYNNNVLTEKEVKLQTARSECKTLRMKLEDATAELKQAQKHSFNPQSYQQGINQSDALAAYTAICDNVQSWVRFHLDAALDEERIELGKVDMDSASKLIELVNPMGMKAFKFAETDEYNIIAIVMEFLRCEVFENELYGAVEVRDLECVRTILKNMESLKPPRGLESRRSWRSETLGAMVHSADFDNRLKIRLQALTKGLLHMLGVIDVAILNGKCFASLQRNIIEPSLTLAHQLHLSIDRFRVQWSTGQQAFISQRSRGPSILERYDCNNLLANGKPVRLEGNENISGDGVTYLFDIVPGFYCQSFKDDTASDLKVLKKPKVLVVMAKPGRRASIPLAGKSGTILGSVHAKLRVKES